MAVSPLVIFHHNTLHWRTNYLSLANTYRKINPDIILINSHGNQNDDKIKIFNYNIIQSNSTGERSDGSAICIRRNIPYKIIDGLSQETIAIQIPIRHEQLTIGTFYSPPRRINLPVQDIIRLLNHNNPTLIAADMNAHSPFFGDTNHNAKGR